MKTSSETEEMLQDKRLQMSWAIRRLQEAPSCSKWKGGHELGSTIGTSEVQMPVADLSSFLPPLHHILIFASYSKSQYYLLSYI